MIMDWKLLWTLLFVRPQLSIAFALSNDQTCPKGNNEVAYCNFEKDTCDWKFSTSDNPGWKRQSKFRIAKTRYLQGQGFFIATDSKESTISREIHGLESNGETCLQFDYATSGPVELAMRVNSEGSPGSLMAFSADTDGKWKTWGFGTCADEVTMNVEIYQVSSDSQGSVFAFDNVIVTQSGRKCRNVKSARASHHTGLCAVENGGCQHTCTDLTNETVCTCQEGFELVNGTQCEVTAPVCTNIWRILGAVFLGLLFLLCTIPQIINCIRPCCKKRRKKIITGEDGKQIVIEESESSSGSYSETEDSESSADEDDEVVEEWTEEVEEEEEEEGKSDEKSSN